MSQHAKAALNLALNALRRDAAEGKTVRGEIADELERVVAPALAASAPTPQMALADKVKDLAETMMQNARDRGGWLEPRDEDRSALYAAIDSLASAPTPQEQAEPAKPLTDFLTFALADALDLLLTASQRNQEHYSEEAHDIAESKARNTLAKFHAAAGITQPAQKGEGND